MAGTRVGVVHVHSDRSHDGRDSLADLYRFALERGIGFVGLTDHAEDLDGAGYREIVEECAELSDERVQLIPGLEYRFAGYPGLHLLALGLPGWIDPRTPGEFVALTREGPSFTIVAHPLLPKYRVPEEVRAGVDAIEIWNAAYNTRYLPDPRAIRLLHEIRRSRPEVVGTAGLDQHDARNDRGTRVVLDDTAPPDPLEALRAGRFTSRGVTMQMDAAVSFGPVRLLTLTAMRRGLDAVNRVHETVMKSLRGVRR
ncbi:MAG: PHP domain-containing protein [Gemmatimonadales bacterium]